jgi:P2 family phage major capsid protein
MKNETRLAVDAYLQQIATLNDVPTNAVGHKFTVSPSVEQTLETKIQESSAFLQQINVYGVGQQEGEKLGMGVGSSIASTTDTTTKDRITSDITTIDAIGYRCDQTNFDSHITYQRLDMWAKFPDFQTRIRDMLLTRQALDRITIGFNGLRRAATSDRAANPLLQDVNKGWLQKYREFAARRVMGTDAAKIEVGTGKAYTNLDALVYDMVANLIDPWHRSHPGLVAICGRGLLSAKYFPVLNDPSNKPNTERVAADVVMSSQRLGGLPAVSVPFFPDNAVFVTPLENLSVYWQEGTRRRSVVENSKRDRIENFESVNEGYAVEDFGAGALAEYIKLVG